MQIVEFTKDSLRFLDALPSAAPEGGFVWIFLERPEVAQRLGDLQRAAQSLGGSTVLDVHLDDIQNDLHPSRYDFTSIYDLIVFRRLATAAEVGQERDEEAVVDAPRGPSRRPPRKRTAAPEIRPISSRAVGFVVFDRLLISTHPPECYSASQLVQRFIADVKSGVDVAGGRNRIPSSPADLTLRMINAMVDSYLDLRKELSSHLSHWQSELLNASSRFDDWGALMRARNQLHVLEDLCDEQQDAVQEWLDTIAETPLSAFHPDTSSAQAQRDQLTARARDVLEHIQRVMHHARRLEQSAETVVQIHFSAQSHRTNDIMRTLTALTAIFLPLNLIAGIFGMNFEFLPLIHAQAGFWWALASMLATAVALGVYFWRKRYLARTRR
jgi:magnesium transporter